MTETVTKSALTSGTVFDDLPVSGLQKAIFAICFVLNMLDGMDVVLLSFIATSVGNEFGMVKKELGFVFSAGLVGMAIGGLGLGAYADVLGRRRIIIWSLALISVTVFLGSLSGSVSELALSRFATGLGIGGLLASVTAVTAEFAPARVRQITVMAVTSGYPLGAMVTGLVCSVAVPEIGWRLTMAWAAGLTLLMIPVCSILLPESVGFLSARSGEGSQNKIKDIFSRMGHPVPEKIEVPADTASSKDHVRKLVSKEYLQISIGLWGGLMFTFMVMYYLLSWIPVIALEMGMPQDKAIITGAIFSGGGFLGVFAAGFLASKFGYARSISFYCVGAFVFMILFATYKESLIVTLMLACIVGFLVQGAVGAFYGAAARAYPIALKSTGVGWTIGIGRVGAIVGPYLGGILLSVGTPQWVSFSIFGGFMLVAALFLLPLRKTI